MGFPAKIKVDVEEDRMGNIIVTPTDKRFAKAFSKARKDNGGGSGLDAFFQDGGPAEEFRRENMSAKQRRDLDSGWPVRMMVDPWVVGHWYGYDAHTVAEENDMSLRQRGYFVEAFEPDEDEEDFGMDAQAQKRMRVKRMQKIRTTKKPQRPFRNKMPYSMTKD